MSEFKDNVLGKCKFKDGFYVINENYGGYSYDCEHGHGGVQYANPKKVIELAKSAGKDVHLAGDAWKLVDKKGLGEKVSPDEALKLVEALKQKEWAPKPIWRPSSKIDTLKGEEL